MTETSPNQVIFLSGAEMWPTDVRAAWPGARFVARAWVEGDDLPVAETFASMVDSGIWGIVLRLPATAETPATGMVAVATTDDGRQFAETRVATPLAGGDPPDVLKAALYWELPPAYTNRLRVALAAAGTPVESEEPRDDGSLG